MTDRHYQLKVTSDTTNIDVSSVDADEVARIVQLAGLAPAAPTAPEIMPAVDHSAEMNVMPQADMEINEGESCSICGSHEHTSAACPQADADLTETQAEYDYGYADVDDEGHPVNVKDYTYKTTVSPQRMVKGMSGDNPLLAELHEHLVLEYKKFVEESIENDGSLSPLSTPDRAEFDTDPFSGDTPVDDGSHSPMSTIKRQPALK